LAGHVQVLLGQSQLVQVNVGTQMLIHPQNSVMTVTLTEHQNVMKIVLETLLVGIVQEEAHQLLQIVSLSVEMAYELELKPVMTGLQLKITKSVSMIVLALKTAGIVQERLVHFQLVQLNAEIQN